jgi:phospholipid/cholesterol/gamma-HCH transport system substrate-binding protein
MENKAHALAAGLFALLLGAALVAVAMWFGKHDDQTIPFLVKTSIGVSGLKAEAPVRYRGVEVGRVRSIRIDPGIDGLIRITIGVADGTPVTRSTYARLGYQGVTGLAYVGLDDSGASKELLRSTPRKMAEIPMRRSIMDTGEDLIAAFGEIATRVNTLLDENNQKAVRRALSGLELATLKTAALADKAALLADKTVALAEELKPGVAGVAELVGDARGAIGKANGLIVTLNGLASKIGDRVEALNRVAKSVEEVGSTARAVNDETLPRLNALVEDLHKETRALDRLLNALGDHPQSIVFGAPPGAPGPGESGFAAGGGK